MVHGLRGVTVSLGSYYYKPKREENVASGGVGIKVARGESEPEVSGSEEEMGRLEASLAWTSMA